MEEYNVLRIQVLAPSEYVNDNKKEMELAGEISDFEDELKEWLRNRSRGTKFAFKVLEDFENE